VKEESLEALEAIPLPALPRVVHEGVYRLYEKPDGTMRVQYRRNDKDEDDFFELPGVMVRMAKAASEGKLNPMDMMREVMKMRGMSAS
jgi:hypothetical protein